MPPILCLCILKKSRVLSFHLYCKIAFFCALAKKKFVGQPRTVVSSNVVRKKRAAFRYRFGKGGPPVIFHQKLRLETAGNLWGFWEKEAEPRLKILPVFTREPYTKHWTETEISVSFIFFGAKTLDQYMDFMFFCNNFLRNKMYFSLFCNLF
jgi:hypothetical protein